LASSERSLIYRIQNPHTTTTEERIPIKDKKGKIKGYKKYKMGKNKGKFIHKTIIKTADVSHLRRELAELHNYS
jgi:hypothetical protein